MADVDVTMDAGAGGAPAFGPAPGGPIPNYINPETLAPANIAVAMVFTVVAIISTVIRIMGNWQQPSVPRRLRITWDDACIIIALGLSIFSTVIVVINTKYGTGRHPIDIPLEWLDPNNQIFPSRLVFAILAHMIGLGIIKVSLLIFFARIIPGQTFLRACQVMGFIVVGTAISVSFATIFACNPIKAWWDFTIPRDVCIDYVTMLVWGGALNAAADIAIVLLPMPTIYNSFMSKRKKIQVMGMFSLGLLVSVASWIRVGYLIKGSRDPSDLSWEGAIQSIASAIEINVALVCANLPLCKRYVTVRFPKLFGGLLSTHNDSVKLSDVDGSGAKHQMGYGKSKNCTCGGKHSALDSKGYPGCVTTTSSIRSINNGCNDCNDSKEWA